MPPVKEKSQIDPCPDVTFPNKNDEYKLEEMTLNGFTRLCCRCNDGESLVTLCSENNWQDRVCEPNQHSNATSTISIIPNEATTLMPTLTASTSGHSSSTMSVAALSTTSYSTHSSRTMMVSDHENLSDGLPEPQKYALYALGVAILLLLGIIICHLMKKFRRHLKGSRSDNRLDKVPPVQFIQALPPTRRNAEGGCEAKDEAHSLLSASGNNAHTLIADDWNKKLLDGTAAFFKTLGDHPTILFSRNDAKRYGEAMGVGRIDLNDLSETHKASTPELLLSIFNKLRNKNQAENSLVADTINHFSEYPDKRLLMDELKTHLRKLIPEDHRPPCMKV